MKDPSKWERRSVDLGRLQLLKSVPMLSRLAPDQMTKLLERAEVAEYHQGEYIVQQGEVGDAMYIIEEGGGQVRIDNIGDVDKRYSPGEVFGELSLLTHQPRGASVVASCEPTRCLRVLSQHAVPILSFMWGGEKELAKREKQIAKVRIFSGLSRGEIRVLCTALERVVFSDQNKVVVREGDDGDCMYVVESGSLMVRTEENGLVAELGPADYFGELSLLTGQTRQATVRTPSGEDFDPVVLLRLSSRDVQLLLSSEKCAQALEIGRGTYDRVATLKRSKVVAAAVRKFWDLMVLESSRLAGPHGSDQVTREGYIQMHIRTSKALSASFDIDTAQDMANNDWAEDITAHTGAPSIVAHHAAAAAAAAAAAVAWFVESAYAVVFQRLQRWARHEVGGVQETTRLRSGWRK
jgi:CRP-like cAMP-binding protein